MNTARITPDVKKIPIDSQELGFSIFVINGSKILGINIFGELIDVYFKNDTQFRHTFGKKSREEIRRKIIIKNAIHLRVVRDND